MYTPRMNQNIRFVKKPIDVFAFITLPVLILVILYPDLDILNS